MGHIKAQVRTDYVGFCNPDGSTYSIWLQWYCDSYNYNYWSYIVRYRPLLAEVQWCIDFKEIYACTYQR